ncbi:MAG: citrate lyase subunit alpha, partial [Spirochaetia bacterium]|nr:citrate lyase subunit alpha [Spirochaetia bacterium]
LKDSGLPIKNIHQLKKDIEAITGIPEEISFQNEIVGIVEYRDGTIIDSIRKV